MIPAVSVVIPFYKVSKYISRCAESLMLQTLENVEFIFVDDASPDDSRDKLDLVLANYPGRNVRVVSHEFNMGLPSARNTGLKYASGNYVYHCDSDDWLERDMLEKLYTKAVETDADYVWCDFFISFEQTERHMKARDYHSVDDLIIKGYLSGDMKYNVWNKLVKRSVYDDNCILFPDTHSMGEDMTMIKLAACSDSVAYVQEALYHYVKINGSSYTQKYDSKKLDDIYYNAQSVCEFLNGKEIKDIFEAISLFKLNIKLPFLLTGNKDDFFRWKEWFPEANPYIFKNKELPLRTKLLQWCAANNFWLLVRLYYTVVYKFMYGVIYK